MTFIITEPCIGTKDTACVDVCPVDCIHPTKENDKFFEGTGEIILKNGDIAATGFGKYRKLSLDRISNVDLESLGWRVVPSEDDPSDIEF